MNRHHFKIAIRFFWRNKAFALINVAGLALGIACTLLIAVILRHEAGYDRFHTQADETYRLTRIGRVNGEEIYEQGMAYPLAAAVRDRLPAAMRGHPYIRKPYADGDIEAVVSRMCDHAA